MLPAISEFPVGQVNGWISVVKRYWTKSDKIPTRSKTV